jgi:hypothetical protein
MVQRCPEAYCELVWPNTADMANKAPRVLERDSIERRLKRLTQGAGGATSRNCQKALGLDVSALREGLKIAKGEVVSFLAGASEHGAMVFI